MIIIHLFVPYKEAESIKLLEKECEDFRIYSYSRNRNNQMLFVVETTEEELVFLKLKYGNKNAWIR